MPATQNTWFRIREALPNNPTLHKVVLAYASDINRLTTATLPHSISILQPDGRLASLDHSIWFHRPMNCNEWLLYATEPPGSSGGREYSRGNIFNAEGELVVSNCQDGLTRKLNNILLQATSQNTTNENGSLPPTQLCFLQGR